MNHDSINPASTPGVDWKGLGYLVSIVSVFFLGAVAWPKPSDPPWAMAVLIGGMVTSILGMALRYLSHLQQLREIRKAREDARKA